MPSRRKIIGGSAAVVGLAMAGPLKAQVTPSIRVGVLLPRTGAAATIGIMMEQGINVFVKEHAGLIGNRTVNLIFADTASNPAVAKSKTQELVEREKVEVILGPVSAFEALAISDYLRTTATPTIGLAAAEELTQRKPNPWFTRATATSSQASHPLGQFAAVDRKYKRIVTIGEDSAYEHEQVSGFQRTFEENGGKIVNKIWTPLSIPDWGPFLSQIKDADAVFAALVSSNGYRLIKQFDDYGLKGKVALLGGTTCVDEAFFGDMGDEALGVTSASFYSGALENAANKKFVGELRQQYKAAPGYYSVSGYIACQMLDTALKTLKGTYTKAELESAIRGVHLSESPRGPFSLDALGNPIGNIYIRELRRGADGKLANVVIKTYENVNQFWTSTAGAYLAAPPYSRDYSPAKK